MEEYASTPGDLGTNGEEEYNGCEQCGLCCKVFGDRITPTAENVLSWMEEGREDILRFTYGCRTDDEWVCCVHLEPRDLGDLVIIEFREPGTARYLPACPFLRRKDKKKYSCAIHDVEPEMCRNYRPWIWGETYFPRCPAVRR